MSCPSRIKLDKVPSGLHTVLACTHQAAEGDGGGVSEGRPRAATGLSKAMRLVRAAAACARVLPSQLSRVFCCVRRSDRGAA